MKTYNLLLINDVTNNSVPGFYKNSKSEFDTICDVKLNGPILQFFNKVQAKIIFRNYLDNFYSYYFNSELDFKEISSYLKNYIAYNFVNNFLLLEIKFESNFFYTTNLELMQNIQSLIDEKDNKLKETLKDADLIL